MKLNTNDRMRRLQRYMIKELMNVWHYEEFYWNSTFALRYSKSWITPVGLFPSMSIYNQIVVSM